MVYYRADRIVYCAGIAHPGLTGNSDKQTALTPKMISHHYRVIDERFCAYAWQRIETSQKEEANSMISEMIGMYKQVK